MLVVHVELEIDPKLLDAFLSLITENARLSLACEPGCHQFDVTQDPHAPHKITLYELYADSIAFDIHKQTLHYLAFDSATEGMIISKTVRLLNRIFPSLTA